MIFEEGHLYHIYNQGNNRQKIFFERENFLFFLQKMRTYLLPHCDILAYCLMPNHFHWMVLVNNLEITIEPSVNTDGVTLNIATEGFAQSETLGNGKLRSLNQSIGILLRSYTNAINKQEKRSGSLFRRETKAECLTEINGITPSFYSTQAGTVIHIDRPEDQYPQVCFNYIHQNPVRSGLVTNETDWEFSSAQDYAGMRNGTLVNKEIIKDYIVI